VFEANPWSLHYVLCQTLSDAVEYEHVHSNVVHNWSSPQQSFVKLNTDSSWDLNLDRIGGGGVIHDELGRWLLGFTSFLGQGGPFLAEARALKLGLQLARDLNFKHVMCEIECLDIYLALQPTTDVSSH